MKSRWNPASAPADDLGRLIFASRLLGQEPDLALHGGGNTSYKGPYTGPFGFAEEALFVKRSGADLGDAGPDHFIPLRLDSLKKLATGPALPDERMADAFELCRLAAQEGRPSIETLMHALVQAKFVLHTHPLAVLALTNRADSAALLKKAFGDSAACIDYARSGMELATACAKALAEKPVVKGIVISHHGLLTWGATADEAYAATLDFVTRAEDLLNKQGAAGIFPSPLIVESPALTDYHAVAPVLRGLLSAPTDNPDKPFDRPVLVPLLDSFTREALGKSGARELFVSPPLTPDYLVRMRCLPLWVEAPELKDPVRFREQVKTALQSYVKAYRDYLGRHGGVQISEGACMPRVVLLPGLGAVCAGVDARSAAVVRDYVRQDFRVKSAIARSGGSCTGLSEDHVFDMESRLFQRAKAAVKRGPLSGVTALVTGAAGAIGMGVSERLLAEGAHLAVTDLPGPALDSARGELDAQHRGRVIALPLDVTIPESVAAAFKSAARAWGGLDLLVLNAGIAHAAALENLDLEDFRRLEQVNVEGTLLMLREAARHFRLQGTGGDIVLVSTKNVFAPGAKFGAYSATKAAAHQLARIAVVELAELGVRVNMVAPDAVFSHGQRKSGLWAEVGPDRMKARGLDEQGLEAYYRSRNLLKAKVTADHVAAAVAFFARRETPTTGATLPVDGGLPDATPR